MSAQPDGNGTLMRLPNFKFGLLKKIIRKLKIYPIKGIELYYFI